MSMPQVLNQLQATACPQCNGHGFTRGVFHAFPCFECGEVGYVQRHGQRRLDRLASGVIARAKAEQAAARAQRIDTGTPDNWTLKNNYRGD